MASRHRLAEAALLALLVAASIAPVQSYDAFWHLATGRWIVEHRALPATDPFALASDPVPWHNGEWLFEILLYGLERAGGLDVLSLARALAMGLFFLWIYRRGRTDGLSAAASLALTAIAFAGADHRMGVRPEIAGNILAALVTGLLLRRGGGSTMAAVALLTAVWINLHPSALLAPAIALALAAGHALARETRLAMRSAVAAALAAAALLVSPWGWNGVLAPLSLAARVSGRTFVNAEWLPSDPRLFPLLYLAIAGGAAVLLFDRSRDRWGRALLFALFSLLAVRYVRNHGVFFCTLPVLLASPLASLAAAKERRARLEWVVAGAAALLALSVVASRGVGLGVDAARFPVSATDQLARASLRGGIYNPDQFGGYLIWRFYPERRVLTDGRNELHGTFLELFDRARRDSRAWNAIFERYRLTLAVEEYRRGTIEVRDAATGAVSRVPPSAAYFPRSRWALIGFDDVAMVFARRDAHPPEVIERLEYRTLVPDGPALRVTAPGERELAAAELRRARSEIGPSARLAAMEAMIHDP